MDEAAVAQAIETLQAEGKECSIGNLRKVLEHGSLRDITKYRKQLLPHMGRARAMDTPAVADTPRPPAPVPAVAVVEPPPTLLQQAEAALQEALVAERQARRATDLATTVEERDRCQLAWVAARRERERAATRHAQLQRSLAVAQHALSSLRIAARRAMGELTAIEDQVRRALITARREARQAQDALDRTVQDIVTMGGRAAVPAEEG